MQIGPTSRARLGRWLVAGWIFVVAAGCGDDAVEVTDTASGTGTGTSAGESSSTVDTPTSTDPPTTTDGGMTDGTASASTTAPTTTPTTAPSTTEDTTQGLDTDTSTGSTGDSSTGSTGDTDSSTTDDTTTGEQPRSRSVTQTVNAGHVIASPNFRMVFTMGQPTQNQGTTNSPSFRLRGGLVGANGSPP